MFVEARLFAIPVGTIYKGNINPGVRKAQKKKKEEIKIVKNDDVEI